MKQYHFELKTNRRGETFLEIIGANNEIIATGEGCKNRMDVVQTIDTIKEESANAPVIDKTHLRKT